MAEYKIFLLALLTALLLITQSTGGLSPAPVSVKAAPQQQATPTPEPGDVVISQFRFRGPAGPEDEFIELFNRTCAAVDLSGMYVDRGSDSSTYHLHLFPPGTILQGGQYYLLANPGDPPNLGYSGSIGQTDFYNQGLVGPDDEDGIALIRPDSPEPTIIDQVGTTSTAYHEGMPLTPLPTNEDKGYQRNTASGMYLDNNNNSTDFSLLSPSAPHNSSDNSGVCGTPTPTPTLTPTITSTPTITNTPTVTLTPNNTPTGFHPRLVINEVAWYGVPDNTSEDWIELYNPTNADIDLTGWTLEAQDGLPTIDLTGVVSAHGFHLLARASSATEATTTPTAAPTPACRIFQISDHVTIDQIFYPDLSTSNETLFLVDPSNIVEDYANRNGGSWPAGSTTHSASMERTGGDSPIPDSDTAWVTYADSPTSFVHDCHGNRVYGTPGGQNWAYNKTPTPTPKPTKTPTTRPPTAAPKVVINEFLPRAGFDWNQDGAVDVNDEFIELKNLGPINVDLKNWKLDDEANLGSSPFTLPSQVLKPGDRAVFYGSTTHILLDDSGDSVRVINPAGVVVDARTYGVVAEPDESHCRFPDGYYWRLPCFPTPGTENALTGFVPAAPPSAASKPPVCLLPDTVPNPFRQAECAAFGANIVNEKYWNDQAGLDEFPVQDNHSKWKTRVE